MKRIYSWLILLGFLELVGCRSIPAGYEENEVELSSVALLHDQVGKLKTEIALVQVAMEKEIASVNTIKNLVNAYESYKSNSGFQPMDNGFLEALIRKDETFAGLYLHPMKISTTDAWGNPLLIQSNKNGDYWIASGGSDGKFSGFEQEGIYILESLEDFSKDIIFHVSEQDTLFGFSYHPQFKILNTAISEGRQAELREKITTLKNKNKLILASREYSDFMELLNSTEMGKFQLHFAIKLISYLMKDERQAFRILTFAPRAVPDDLLLTKLTFAGDAISINVATKTDEPLATINGKLQKFAFFSQAQAKQIYPGLQLAFNYQRNFKKKKSELDDLRNELLKAQMEEPPNEVRVKDLEKQISKGLAGPLAGDKKQQGGNDAELDREMELSEDADGNIDTRARCEELLKLAAQLRKCEASKTCKKVENSGDLEKEYEYLDRQLRIYERNKEKASQIQEEANSNKIILQDIRGILPPSAELDSAYKKVKAVATKANIKIESMAPAMEVATDFYDEVRIKLTANGNLADWQVFLDQLFRLKRIFNIYGMDLSAAGKDIRKSPMRVTCIITTYYSELIH